MLIEWRGIKTTWSSQSWKNIWENIFSWFKKKKRKSPKKTKNIKEIYQPKIKGIYEKPIADMLNGGECFPLKSGTRQSTCATLLNIVLEVIAQLSKKKK